MTRLFLLIALALVVTLSASGCLSDESGTPTTEVPDSTSTVGTTAGNEPTASGTVPTTAFGSDEGGKLSTYLVQDPPDGATVVDSTDSRIGDATYVQELLQRTVENGPITTNINGSQLDRLDRELEDVPYTSGGKSGYYIRYDGTVVRIMIARYQ
jgi:hypothetical protein